LPKGEIVQNFIDVVETNNKQNKSEIRIVERKCIHFNEKTLEAEDIT